MGSHSHSPSLEHQNSDAGIRKRVCKACDRCRLKKSKCDGSSPCSRCKADNAICVFGERKKSHDRVYPKGYVEMLEQQQSQLVAGLQEMYKRAVNGQGWEGSPLTDSTNGHPLTHDILERLGTLKQEGHGDSDLFEEDLNLIQHRLIANGAGFMQRAESPESSESLNSPILDPMSATQPSFAESFTPQSQLPPTPPEERTMPQKLPPRSVQVNAPSYLQPTAKSTSLNPAVLQQQSWSPVANELDESLAFQGFDPMGGFDASIPSQFSMPSIPMYSMPGSNFPPRDWSEEQALRNYYNPMLA